MLRGDCIDDRGRTVLFSFFNVVVSAVAIEARRRRAACCLRFLLSDVTEHRHIRAERVRELHADVAESAKADDRHLLPGTGLPMVERGVES